MTRSTEVTGFAFHAAFLSVMIDRTFFTASETASFFALASSALSAFTETRQVSLMTKKFGVDVDAAQVMPTPLQYNLTPPHHGPEAHGK